MTFDRTSRAALAALLAAAATGCADAPTSPGAAPESAAVDPLVALGFSPASITEQGEFLVVDGDMLFRKRDLAGPRASRTPSGPRAQYHTTTLATPAKMAGGITFNLGNMAGNASWAAAARRALQIWNYSYGNKIWVSETTGTADLQITMMSSLSGSSVAQTNMPINDNLGSVMYVSQAYNSLSSGQKTWVMVHEIGHAIGFRHTNWSALGEGVSAYGAEPVPGTPGTGGESSSVMTQVFGRSWSSFTASDLLAASVMYPSEAAPLTAAYDAADHPRLEWGAVPEVQKYRVTALYLVETWMYEPTLPDYGYWGYDWAYTTVGETTGTSMTASAWTRSQNAYCSLYYYVEPIYPSGKLGTRSVTQTFDAC